MSKNITIQGVEFEVSTPYAEGHACTEAEAKALNQTRSENIRNNCAKIVKEAKTEHGDELPADVLKSVGQAVGEYDKDYQFTLASVGGGRASRDPVEVEATKIARAAITAKLKEAGRKVSDVDKDALAAKIAEVAANPKVMKAAKKAVVDRAALASDALENFDI